MNGQAERLARDSDFVKNDNGELRLDVREQFLFVEGTINSTTNVELIMLLDANPHITTLVLTSVPGSMDDETNVDAGRQIRKRGLTTLLLGRSEVSSGGTDLFLAGESRIIVKGARIGVHSWAGSPGGWLGWIPWVTIAGRDVPKGDPAHQIYLNYYRDISISEEFYWFTLDRAHVAGMHWMTAQEIARFDVATQIMDRDGRTMRKNPMSEGQQ